MAICVVIGKERNAKEIQRLLDTSNVPTLAILHNLGNNKIVATCEKEKGLKVIAVCCADCGTGGIPLLTALQKSFGGSVHLHAIVEGNEDSDEIELLTEVGVSDTFFQLPLKPFDAAKNIKQRWFPRDKNKIILPDEEVEQRNVTRVNNARTVRPLDGDKIAVAVVGKSAQAVVTRILPRSVVAVTAPIKIEIPSILDMLMKKTRRNNPLPERAVPVSIIGKNGQIVQLDPRRIRPLPENPRGEDSPGFTKESLIDLGMQIKNLGQMEEAKVCPIDGDPMYDAQLIDGDRRKRSTEMVGIMLWVSVREDVTPAEAESLYLMSVLSNLQKERPTTREYIRIVSNLRGSPYNMTIRQIAEAIGLSSARTEQLHLLGKLDPEVQNMLADARTEGGGSTATKGYVFTSQLALLLVDIAQENQRAVAEEIRSKRMNYLAARRYVHSIRRGLGLGRTPEGVKRNTRHFDSMATLIRRSIEAFGIFIDIPTGEMIPILMSRTPGERNGVSQDLHSLIKTLNELAESIDRIGAVE